MAEQAIRRHIPPTFLHDDLVADVAMMAGDAWDGEGWYEVQPLGISEEFEWLDDFAEYLYWMADTMSDMDRLDMTVCKVEAAEF